MTENNNMTLQKSPTLMMFSVQRAREHVGIIETKLRLSHMTSHRPSGPNAEELQLHITQISPFREVTSESSPQHHHASETNQLTARMFLQRSAVVAARRVAAAPVLRRTFATTIIRRE